MLLSRYLLKFSHPTDPTCTILFSTRSGAQVVMDNAGLARLKRGEAMEAVEPLAHIGLLVEDHQQERREVHGLIDQVNALSEHLSVAVILGMACNFSCPYCYEGDLKGAVAMADETLDRMVDFLVATCRAQGKKRISLDFYGGEPFLYPARIREISRRLQQAMAAMGGRYDFVLVSNGSLMSRQKVAELLPLGLSGIRLTLDGPAVLHDSSRPYLGGAPSFADITANIKACAGMVALRLGGNYSRYTYHRFPEMFADLAEAGIGPDTFESVRFFPIMQPDTPVDSLVFHGGCGSVSDTWLPGAAVFLREELWRHQYRQQGIMPTPCMVDRDDSFTIHYDGTLCQCPALVGRQECICGDVWHGLREYDGQYQRHNWRQHQACLDCIYLPLCFGGCRAMKYLTDRTMDVDCKKSFLDATLEHFVRQDIRYCQEPE